HERFGDDELAPVATGLRSNGFDWVHEATIDAPVSERCPLRDEGLGITPWDRGRHLFVRHAGKLARYRADTRDFGDTEIEHVKHELGQVYLDASRKPAPDDFIRDLAPLRRAGLCTGCPAYATCTGMFEAQSSSPFEHADEDLRARLSGLVGDVLELGCGSGRTADALATRVRTGEVRYVAVDPDAEALEELRARLPAAVTRCGAAEDVLQRLPTAVFDHALVLQAWNHLLDPRAVLEGLARVLRPGAVLIVTDDTAFGLARTRSQRVRARSSGARFEHVRNDDAGRAAARVDAVPGFALVERRDVRPTTSTQWLLRYRRTP
ncbi:MAG TPA: class I SAM-dependent methyltransferase, partial [Nannocystaceae bacterium]|nr:class I SAM-dependent methyltransferase [Nannocystaceae bacterium]